MGRNKRNRRRKAMSATERAAEATVSPWLRRHGKFVRERFTDRDTEDGLQDNARMRRASPIKVLERMATTRGRETTPYLDQYQMEAANRLHCLIDAAKGGMNHEIKERVQTSGTASHVETKTIAVMNLEAVYSELPDGVAKLLRQVFGPWADHPLTLFFPNQRHRQKVKYNIRYALDELARYFGLLT